MPQPPRRLLRPWSVVEHQESFEVRTANGLTISFCYFDDDRSRREMTQRLTKDEARRAAANIAKLPELLRMAKGIDPGEA
jgi:arginine utilization protein RocB